VCVCVCVRARAHVCACLRVCVCVCVCVYDWILLVNLFYFQLQENWAKEICTSKKISIEVKQSELVKNSLMKKLEAEEVPPYNEQQELQNTIHVVTNRVKSLNMRSNVPGNCSTSTKRVTFGEWFYGTCLWMQSSVRALNWLRESTEAPSEVCGRSLILTLLQIQPLVSDSWNMAKWDNLLLLYQWLS
jgi:hypothetical protein